MELNPVKLSVYIAIVFAATISVQIYQPFSGGYFNLGEAAIYTIALSSTPLAAGLAGGLGSFLADITTGYGIFAPGTLIIKFTEGYIASFLSEKLSTIRNKKIGILIILIYAFIFISLTSRYLTGQAFIGPTSLLWFEMSRLIVDFSLFFWIIVSLPFVIISIVFLLKMVIEPGNIIALSIAGSLMVVGYFVYEYLFTNPMTGRNPIDAIWEIPINVLQMTVGLAVAVPLVSWLRRAKFTVRAY